jgi:hypothetical protein
VSRPKTRRVGADLAFASYVEPDELGFDELLTARDLMLERLLRARSQRAKEALAAEAARHGLTVEADPEDFGGEAA